MAGTQVNTVALIGVGLMGGSIGLAARERAGVAEVRGFSQTQADPRPGARARRDHAWPAAASRRPATARDLIFVCTPVRTVVKHVRAALAAAPPDAVVTDVGSTKGPLMRALSPDEQRRCIGGHPLCGSETAGVANARASLYQGATYFVTPGDHVDADAYQLLYAFLGEIGARPVAVDPEEHDRVMAVVSHLPHVLANVLMSQAGLQAGARDALLSAGPSFRDLTRIAGTNRRVWTDIFLDNRAELLAALAQFQEGLQEVLEALAAGRPPAPGRHHRPRARAARAHARRRQSLGGGPVRTHHPGERPSRACSARSWWPWATRASTSRTSPCTT